MHIQPTVYKRRSCLLDENINKKSLNQRVYDITTTSESSQVSLRPCVTDKSGSFLPINLWNDN